MSASGEHTRRVLLDPHDRAAALGVEMTQRLLDHLDEPRREAQRRFVDQQQLRTSPRTHVRARASVARPRTTSRPVAPNARAGRETARDTTSSEARSRRERDLEVVGDGEPGQDAASLGDKTDRRDARRHSRQGHRCARRERGSCRRPGVRARRSREATSTCRHRSGRGRRRERRPERRGRHPLTASDGP